MTKYIGRYEIEYTIKSGGQGTVYLATDPTMRRPVAVKVLSTKYINSRALRARFQQEVEIVASMEENEFIVPVYDYGEENKRPYVVMRYMRGGSLAERLKSKSFSFEECRHIITQVAEGLGHAHRRGIVHRDIKPGNILFDEKGKAYIGDFGIAKILESRSTKTRRTRTGTIPIGSPRFMSPEQALGKTDVDGRSDQYSLGVVLFLMLTGRPLFHARTHMGILLAHIQEPPPKILKLLPDLPAGLGPFMDRVFAKAPQDRFSSMHSFVQALADVEGRVSREPEPAKPKRKVQFIVAGLAVLTSLVWAVIAFSRGMPSLGLPGTAAASSLPEEIDGTDTAGTPQSSTPSPTPTEILSSTPLASPIASLNPTTTLLPEGNKLVPDVIGMNYSDAEEVLTRDGYDVSFEYVLNPELDPGTVVSQNPDPGAIYDIGIVTLRRTVYSIEIETCTYTSTPAGASYNSASYFFSIYLNEGTKYQIRSSGERHLEGYNWLDTTSPDYTLSITTQNLEGLDSAAASSGRVTLDFVPEASGYYGIVLRTDMGNGPTTVSICVD